MCERHGLSAVIQNLFSATESAFAAAASPMTPATPEPVAPKRRRKLWELEEKFHCPVVGTCLVLDELKKIARKAGYHGRDFDAYRLHVEAVSLSNSRNPAAEAMQRLLERKYAHVVRRFDAAKTDAAVLELWREHLDRGEVAGAMWAALTHPAASAETRQRIYADVHMLSHQIGAGQAADLRRQASLERALAEARRRLSETEQRHAAAMAQKRAQLAALEAECQRLREAAREAETLRARLARFESGQVIVDMGRRLLMLEAGNAELRKVAARVHELEARVQAMQAENAKLAREREAIAAERDALERFVLDEAQSQELGCTDACELCPERLRGRCVLCVGGRTPLLTQYRRLAERLGVRLVHHDGGREDAMSRLPELLSASDAVICPTDSVSHAAYGLLKRHCKATNKPCVMARTSGLASFAAALARLAADSTDPRHQTLQRLSE